MGPTPQPRARLLGLTGDLTPLGKVVVFALWAGVTLLVAAAHEPWRDEADAWLFARDGDLSPASLRAFTSGAGTPALWYLLLAPLARSGAPYGAMTALHWLIAAAAVGLLVWRAPLPPLLRVVLPFGFLFGYEYVVVARTYSLTILLLFLWATLHPRRRERPLALGLVIGLLASTNAHGFFLAAGLGVALVIDVARAWTPRRGAGAALALALGLVALWQLWPRPDPQALPEPHPSAFRALAAVWDGFLPSVRGAPDLVAAAGLPGALLALAASVAVVALVLGGVQGPLRAGLVLGLGGLLYIFVFRYFGSARHHGLLQALLLAAAWAAAAEAPIGPGAARLRAAAVVWALATLLTVPAALDSWWRDLREPFSGSREAAQFITANGLDRGPIAAHPPNECSAVLPYLRARSLWYAALEAPGSYMTWDAAFSAAQQVPVEVAAERVARRFPRGTLLLLADRLPEPERLGYVLVFRTTRMVFRYDEVYWIYRLDRPR